jgi:hypothetical protein
MEVKTKSKYVRMISGVKGGVGKSALCWLLAEKYVDATPLDLDDATATTMNQLAYRKPVKISFLDPQSKRIDRGAFNTFFESIVEAKKDLFIADLGSSVAEQLPKWIDFTGAAVIKEILQNSNVKLEIIVVVGGGNLFKATMDYLAEVIGVTKGIIEVIVAHNGLYPLTDDQKKVLLEFVKDHSLQFKSFDLLKDRGEMATRTVENVLKEGRGMAGLSPFTSIYFKRAIDELEL